MKKYIFAIPLVLWISGCTEANYVKLSYQVKECLGDYSVRCTDIRIRQSIASTKLFQKKITDGKQRAVAEIGETGYQQLQSLVEQKIHYLEEQRPHLFWRWFRGGILLITEILIMVIDLISRLKSSSILNM